MLMMKLGDVVVLGEGDWVVGVVTATTAGVTYAAQLFKVPPGQLPANFGKTWTSGDPGVETAYVTMPVPLSITTTIEAGLSPLPLPTVPAPTVTQDAPKTTESR
jgi:hypothetical protein